MNAIQLTDPQTSNAPIDFAGRLIQLSDGRHGLRGGIQMDIREPADAATTPGANNPPLPVLEFVASDESLDRYDEIISASGWRLDNYRRNPVFQNAHKYGDIIFTLGKAIRTEVVNGRLVQRVEFATEANPMARIAYGLYRGKFLNAVSVGFIPLRWENGGEKSPYRRKYLEQELIEVSAVGIPANPNALQLGIRAGAVAGSDLLELEEMLRIALDAKRFCDKSTEPTAEDKASAYEAQRLLQLARMVRSAIAL